MQWCVLCRPFEEDIDQLLWSFLFAYSLWRQCLSLFGLVWLAIEVVTLWLRRCFWTFPLKKVITCHACVFLLFSWVAYLTGVERNRRTRREIERFGRFLGLMYLYGLRTFIELFVTTFLVSSFWIGVHLRSVSVGTSFVSFSLCIYNFFILLNESLVSWKIKRYYG